MWRPSLESTLLKPPLQGTGVAEAPWESLVALTSGSRCLLWLSDVCQGLSSHTALSAQVPAPPSLAQVPTHCSGSEGLACTPTRQLCLCCAPHPRPCWPVSSLMAMATVCSAQACLYLEQHPYGDPKDIHICSYVMKVPQSPRWPSWGMLEGSPSQECVTKWKHNKTQNATCWSSGTPRHHYLKRLIK